mmetsp:Transcript_6298/g.26167  ORF Transcript_6298/g.26167 Transcript_6298/m.26167 type:complete len:217 (+) Transcript_6298:588-1238(+)
MERQCGHGRVRVGHRGASAVGGPHLLGARGLCKPGAVRLHRGTLPSAGCGEPPVCAEGHPLCRHPHDPVAARRHLLASLHLRGDVRIHVGLALCAPLLGGHNVGDLCGRLHRFGPSLCAVAHQAARARGGRSHGGDAGSSWARVPAALGRCCHVQVPACLLRQGPRALPAPLPAPLSPLAQAMLVHAVRAGKAGRAQGVSGSGWRLRGHWWRHRRR